MNTRKSIGDSAVGTSSPAHSTSSELFGWIQLTDRCNLRCSYCYMESGRGAVADMAPMLARRALADLSAAGARVVMLSGGEPTLYRDLGDLIEYGASQLGLSITLVTNGVHLQEALLSTLRRHHCSVQVSVDALDPVAYRVARGRPALGRVLRGIDALLDAGIEVTLSSTLTAVSARFAADVVLFALDKGIPLVHFAPNYWKTDLCPPELAITASGFYSVLRMLYELQRAHFRDLCIDLVEQFVIPTAFGRRREHYCNAMAGQTVEITPDGTVYYCAALRELDAMLVGRIGPDASLAELLATATRTGAWPSIGPEQIEGCGTCDVRDACAGGCRAMAVHDGGNLVGRHPFCAEYRHLITDIKHDLRAGELDEYIDFLRARLEPGATADTMVKVF